MAVFGVPAGLPESHVVGPIIKYAGVVYASSPSGDSYWVVADICFDIPTGCEDAGAFQVFHRTGRAARSATWTSICASSPPPSPTLWFPHGRYPMGERCRKVQTAMTKQPVLGSASFIPRIGVGWGTYKPSEIFNGGDPSGMIDGITWSGWGEPEAIGYGKTYIFKPNGGYYPGECHRRATRVRPRALHRGPPRLPDARRARAVRAGWQARPVVRLGPRQDALPAVLVTLAVIACRRCPMPVGRGKLTREATAPQAPRRPPVNFDEGRRSPTRRQMLATRDPVVPVGHLAHPVSISAADAPERRLVAEWWAPQPVVGYPGVVHRCRLVACDHLSARDSATR